MPVIALLIAVTIWGGSFIATKAAVTDIPPIAFALLRFTVATVGLALVHLVTRTPLEVPRPYWGKVALAGFLGTTLTYVLENTALKYTTAGNGALFIAASPLLTIIGATLYLKERLSLRRSLGALLASGGILALVGASFQQTGWGDALMVLNTLVGSFYALISKTIADRLSPLSALTASFGIGTLGLIPFAVGEAVLAPAPWHFTPGALFSLLYLGTASSCLAYWLWMYALSKMSASSVGSFLYLMPVVTLLLSAWLLHEPMGWAKILEASAILAGVYLATTREASADLDLVPASRGHEAELLIQGGDGHVPTEILLD